MQGYTIIELLAVLFIIFLVISMVSPNYFGFLDYYQMQIALKEMASNIRFAQQSALGTGIYHTISFNVVDEAYTISIPGYPVTETIKHVKLAQGIDLLDTNFPSNQLHFTGLGSPSRGGTISFQNTRGKIFTITILPATGRVKVYD